MAYAYIGMGSNLAEPMQQVQAAWQALIKTTGCQWVATSSLYSTRPWGGIEQPDYINCVCLIETQLSPLTLLRQMQAIEQQQGRVRLVRNGPRTIDLDLLLYDNWILNLPELIVPHPRLAERDFVIYPLAELSPELQLPDGRNIAELKAACPGFNIQRII